MSPLAVSVLDEVDKLIDRFGTYAGFASVLGLALLTLLYVAQARELKRLREWAGEMPERVGDLQSRLAPAATQRVTAEPAPVTPAAPATQAAAAAQASAAAQSETQVLPATSLPAAADAPAGEAAASAIVPGKVGADGAKVAGPQPTTVNPAERVNPLERAARPQTARAAGMPPAPPRRPLGPIVASVLAVAAVLGAVGYLLFGTGDSGPEKARTTAITSSTVKKPAARTKTTAATPDRSSISVFVLNGTTINGLARGLANTLEQGGFTIRGTETAADQTRAATLVMYSPGKRAKALEVAKAIKKGPDVVRPVDSGSAALGQGADVIILVGADQNVTASG